MFLFNNQQVLEIRKVGLRDKLITISKMKKYFPGNDRTIISNEVVQAEYAIFLFNYKHLPSIRI